MSENNYNEDSIQVLSGIEHIRQRKRNVYTEKH